MSFMLLRLLSWLPSPTRGHFDPFSLQQRHGSGCHMINEPISVQLRQPFKFAPDNLCDNLFNDILFAV
ncbi:MAG: hypothetical protein CL532_03875 [Aestuariivita sp.]|nr:hypothetical protein [Aestuariivita sp.]